MKIVFTLLIGLCLKFAIGVYLGPKHLHFATLHKQHENLLSKQKFAGSSVPLNLPSSLPAHKTRKKVAQGTHSELIPRRFSWIPNGIKNGIASGLAAVFVKLILQPFDTIKTVQHIQIDRKLGPLEAARAIFQKNGIGGLWSGIGVTVIGSTPSVALYFSVYSSLKKKLVTPTTKRKLFWISASAALANTIACFARVPYEVLKHRIQIGQHDGIYSALVHSYQTEGLFGLFNGGKYFSQVLRDVPYAVVCILSYEIAQSNLKGLMEKSLKTSNHTKSSLTSLLSSNINNMVCGATAGGFGALLTNPMDVIMTRTMTARKAPFIAKLNPSLYPTISEGTNSISNTIPKASAAGLSTIKQVTTSIIQNEGWKALTSGVTANIMGKVPANALFFLWYENLKSLLDVDRDETI